MKNIFCLFILLILIQGCSKYLTEQKDIIGYYPSFRYTENSDFLNPNLLPYEKLTIINYAFFAPDSSGILSGIVPNADKILLSKEGDQSIIRFAHNHGVKVFLSIGGWEDSYIFPYIASNTEKTAKFASECLRVINEYNFDGIDIDWEFPCYAPHNGTPSDKENFTRFLSVIKDSLKTLENRTKHRYLLTAALPATKEHISKIEVKKISGILDFLNLMTYDYHGFWDQLSNHNSPLYAPEKGDSDLCIDSTVKLFLSFYKIPSYKINIGIPFYGRTYANCKDLFMSHSGSDTTIFKNEFDTLYRGISDKMSLFTRHWDKKARVPYLTGKNVDIVVSFDDTESVREKCDYVVKTKLRGVIIWEVTGTIMKDRTTPLLDVIYDKFKSN